MLNIRNAADMARALDSPIDADLKTLLRLRRDQLTGYEGYEGYELADLAHFAVAEPGDHLNDVLQAIGFAPLMNLVDGKHYGDPDFEPSTEWIAEHTAFFECVWVLSDSGFGTVLFVSKAKDVDPGLQAFCREFATNAPPLSSPPLNSDR